MCGMHWYREELERADEDLGRLNELMAMIEQRYKLTPDAAPDVLDGLSSDIIRVYREIIRRKASLEMPKSPQV